MNNIVIAIRLNKTIMLMRNNKNRHIGRLICILHKKTESNLSVPRTRVLLIDIKRWQGILNNSTYLQFLHSLK